MNPKKTIAGITFCLEKQIASFPASWGWTSLRILRR